VPGLGGKATAGASDVGFAVETEQSDGGSAERGHHLEDRASAHLGVVLGKCDIAHIMGAVLDHRVSADAIQDEGGVGGGGRQAGDALHGFGGDLAGAPVGASADKVEHLLVPWPSEIAEQGGGQGERLSLQATMPAVFGMGGRAGSDQRRRVGEHGSNVLVEGGLA
jgi:hypothetical protein